MYGVKQTLIVTALSLSLHGIIPVEKEPLEVRQTEGSLRKFLAAYAGFVMVGTYGYLYWESQSTLPQTKLLALTLGYTGAGFSMATATYVATLIWSETGLFQERTTRS